MAFWRCRSTFRLLTRPPWRMRSVQLFRSEATDRDPLVSIRQKNLLIQGGDLHNGITAGVNQLLHDCRERLKLVSLQCPEENVVDRADLFDDLVHQALPFKSQRKPRDSPVRCILLLLQEPPLQKRA